MKQATMKPIDPRLSFPHCLSLGFGTRPKIPLQDISGMICGNVLLSPQLSWFIMSFISPLT